MLRPFPRRCAGLAWALAAAVALAGCSLFSVDGLTGGDAGAEGSVVPEPDGAPPADAGMDGPAAVDGTAGESGADTGAAGDASVGPDAANDGASPADSGARDGGSPDAADKPDSAVLGFCASQSPSPAFCDDFDEGAANPSFDQVTSLGGTVAVDATQSFSAPDSMVSTVDANQNDSTVDLAGYESLTSKQGVAGTATLEFELRIDAGDTSSAADAVLGAIQLYSGSAIYDLELEVLYASATTYAVSLTEDSPSVPHPTGATIALGVWTHVKLTIVLPASVGGATTATLSLGSASSLSTTVHVLSGGDPIASPIPELLVGPTFATPAAGGWSVRYDNVTFDVK